MKFLLLLISCQFFLSSGSLNSGASRGRGKGGPRGDDTSIELKAGNDTAVREREKKSEYHRPTDRVSFAGNLVFFLVNN